MKKEAKIFNDKYNLIVSDSSFKKVDVTKIISQDLAGRPKKNLTEFLKRFFTSPASLIAFIVLIIIIILSIIFFKTSKWDPNEKIYDFKNVPSYYYNNLPSTSSPFITKVVLDDELTILKFQNGTNNAISLEVLDPNSSLGVLVKYDAWKLLSVITDGDFSSVNSIMGTNSSGIDAWTRLWKGTSESLKLGLIIAIITTLVGTTIGSFIGLYVGTLIDIIFIKILSVYNSIPTIVWITTILFLLPQGQLSLFIVFIITGWTNGLGVSRMYMWRYVNSDFMKQAETMGVSKMGRIFKHALPHYLGFVSYGLVSTIGGVITAEAGLSFLGLSPSPELASLGNVLTEAKETILIIGERPLFLLMPTIIIIVITISLQFMARGISDALETRYIKR